MYKLSPTELTESHLFYRLDGESAERHGAIGYLRADFGRSGFDFYFKWFDSQPHLKTPGFRRELDGVINALRTDGQETPFANRMSLANFCRENYKNGIATHSGYTLRTPDYSYYFRCLPRPDDYDVYCFAFDNRYLLPELAGQHELPEVCYSAEPSTGDIILIKRNERGYYRCEYSTDDAEYNRAFATGHNVKLGVTRAQEEAMLAGSMAGWDIPGAKPWKYDMDGNLRPLPPKRNEPEL
jgi:hypothetical protein